jgi:hypothetical protein
LVHRESHFKREVAKSSFEHFTIFYEDLIGVSHKKLQIKLDKPIYCGMVILDLSKVVMYNYFYDEIKPKYGDDVTVCATDTDSLLMEIKTRDVYRDMMDYKRPIMTKIISCTMKPTKVELFKDETKGLHILAYVGLRSKMYSYMSPLFKEHLVAKGIKESTIKSDLRFQNYYDCLFNKSQMMCKMHFIKSDKHKLHINRVNKTGLCAADDKRWIMNDGIHTLAHGHYKTKDNLK